jgi:hypothetical protein
MKVFYHGDTETRRQANLFIAIFLNRFSPRIRVSVVNDFSGEAHW